MEAIDLESLKQTLSSSDTEKCSKLLVFAADICSRSRTREPGQAIMVLANIAEYLIEKVDNKTLAEAADVFSRLDYAPHSLIWRLAQQPAVIASPVLQHSAVLSDQDLIHIIKSLSPKHQQSVALRARLTSAVTDSIIAFAEKIALMTVVRNKGASFSDNGFADLVAIGKRNQSLAEALCVRPDLPEEIAAPLLDSLGAGFAGKISSSDYATRLGVKFSAQAREAHKIRRERSLFLPLAKMHLRLIGSGEKTLDQSIIELCENKADHALCQVLAASAQITEADAVTAFSIADGTKFIQLCAKLAMGSDAFLAAATLRTKQQQVPNSQIFHLLRQYSSISSIVSGRISEAF